MKTAIVLHHTGTSGDANQFDGVYGYHDRGAGGKWPSGHGIQYHHFIDKDGKDRQGRGEEETCFDICREVKTLWHAGNPFNNNRAIAVCLAGDFRIEMPTEMQIAELRRVVMDVQARHGIPDTEIFLHNEVRSTTCPGTDLRALYFAYRRSMTLPRMYSAQAQVKRLRRAIDRSVGYTKVMLQRQWERLMSRIG